MNIEYKETLVQNLAKVQTGPRLQLVVSLCGVWGPQASFLSSQTTCWEGSAYSVAGLSQSWRLHLTARFSAEAIRPEWLLCSLEHSPEVCATSVRPSKSTLGILFQPGVATHMLYLFKFVLSGSTWSVDSGAVLVSAWKLHTVQPLRKEVATLYNMGLSPSTGWVTRRTGFWELHYQRLCMLGKVTGVIAFYGEICRVGEDGRLKKDSVRTREMTLSAKCLPLQAGEPGIDHQPPHRKSGSWQIMVLGRWRRENPSAIHSSQICELLVQWETLPQI